MSTAPNYTPGTSFADDETNNVAGRSIIKTNSLDSELADISSSINGMNTNLQALQRDDSKLKDEIVEPYALSEQSRALIAVAGCNPRGTWAQNIDYKYKDIIQFNNVAQMCQQSHNSGTVFTQSFWLPISGDGTSAANAAAASASAASALASQNSAATSAASAATSATNAGNSATSAASASTNAANSASSAGTSATNSANSASQAAASAASINAPKNATNDPTFSSTSSNVAASPEWVKGLFHIGTPVTANGGAAYDFAIPAGVKEIIVSFDAYSTTGTSLIQVQLGTSGGITNTGYQSGVSHGSSATQFSSSTSGFVCTTSAMQLAASTYHGKMTLTNHAGNEWVEDVGIFASGTIAAGGGGSVTLSNALTTVRVTTVGGTDTKDGGSLNVSWRF